MEKPHSDMIREYVVRTYIDPARRRGETSAVVVVGDVHKALKMHNRVPMVCSSLRAGGFLRDHGLALEVDGPPSGQSTTVKYRYTWSSTAKQERSDDPFLELYGTMTETFAAFGGGEKALQDLRDSDRLDGDE